MANRNSAILSALMIGLSACQSPGQQTEIGSPPVELNEEGCPAVEGYRRDTLEKFLEHQSKARDINWKERAEAGVSGASLPPGAEDADYRLIVNAGGRKKVTYWKDDANANWQMAGSNPFETLSFTPTPPPPPPPPPPPGTPQEEVDAFWAEQERLAELRRNPPPPPTHIYDVLPEFSSQLDGLFFDRCVDAGPNFAPGYFATGEWSDNHEDWDIYVCPPDGSFWIGEIVKPGAAQRPVSTGCRSNKFALSDLLVRAGYVDPEDVTYKESLPFEEVPKR
ncbi:MAG: hypothetical protein CMK07_15755 [Ponticaulis sp.]|nr:hypothetical protein [Ponticaulis sp.]